MSREPAAWLDGVVKRYHEGETEHIVLSGATARIERGETVALLGPSGSGKSTVLNLLGGIDRPDAGRVRVAGVELAKLDEKRRTLFRRTHIGFVFQFFNLIPTLSVEENLRLPLQLAGRPAESSDVLGLLEQVGLAHRAGSAPDRLSGGEQQRVAVARALIHEPALILADEPTGNLDAENGRTVLALIDDLVRARGGTMIVVTHNEQVAARSDRVLRLENGRIEPGSV